MKVGSLFSGIGGFDLGLERAGYEISWQVENNEHARKVLRKHWPAVPCYGDIKAIDWRDIPAVDLVCGGFPCQPFSCAGKRAGKDDDRYLWPEVVRCLAVLQPTWFLGENVPGIINMALDQVCTDLEGLGYTVWPVCLPACAVDAPHQRQRIWIVAHACQQQVDTERGVTQQRRSAVGWDRQTSQQHHGETSDNGPHGCREDVAHAARLVLNGSGKSGERRRRELTNQSRWLPEPAVGGMVDGLSRQLDEGGRMKAWPVEPVDVPRVATGVKNRVDRLKGLGNAIVPQIAEALGRMIIKAALAQREDV